MMDDLISIIIPAYNVEKYLNRCLETVVNQTYENIEIILIDDGSTDQTPILCDTWATKDQRIKVVHKRNEGLSAARNTGMEYATGKYVGFVDSDDWIELDMFKYLYQLINKYHVEAAFCDFRRLKDKKKVKNEKELVIIRTDEELDRYFYRIDGGKSSYAVWCGLYNRDVIKNIKFIIGEINEDVLFRYEVYKNIRKIAFSNLCKYNYFINEAGITKGKLSQKDYSLFRIWDYIVEQEKNTCNYEYAVLNRKRATYTLYVKGVLCGNENVEKNTLNDWKQDIKRDYSVLKKGKVLNFTRKFVLWFIYKFM